MNSKMISKCINQHLSLNQDSKVLIVGLGETGLSIAHFLHKQAIPFAVIDSRDNPPCSAALLQDYPDIAVFTGGFSKPAFKVATHLLVSPGVCLREKAIQGAIKAGAKLVSDIDLFACATDKPIVAITGSNGKSTVTTMLGAMANEDRIKTAIGGNLGIPALDLLDESIELYVLELSSFQLERTSVLNAEVATVLNISADHLDRHTDMEEYTNEKENIFAGKGVMVINEDDPSVKEMVIKNRETLFFSVQKKLGFHIDTHQNEEWLMNKEKAIIRRAELPLEGLHNVANALAALALGSAIGLDERAMCMGLRGYKGLCHRMQKVAKIKGVTWINDSKATNIGACIAALQGYEGKVILIAGGDAKGADLDELIPAIKAKAKCVLLLGKDANKIEEAINGSVPSYQTNTLQEAVKIAADLAKKGDCVLLSPACASLDQYKNYQERGDQFTAAVKGLAA